VARFTSLVVLVALAVLAAGCSGGSSKSAGTTSESGGAARAGETLTIYGFGTGDDVAVNRAKIARKAIAPAKVENPEGAFAAQAFLTRLASGNVPDLVYLDRQQVATLAAKGALTPLNSCVQSQNVDRSQYYPAALTEATYKGQLYALPEFTNQRALIVNNAAVKDAGLNVSDVQTKDWAKLKTVTKKLTKQSGGKLTRIGFDPKLPEFFILWAKANGADLLSKDGLHPRFTDPKVVAALTYAKSLIDEQGGWSKFKAFRDTWDFFGAKNQVAEDQIGAWPMESWYWNVIAQNSPKVSVTAVPFTTRTGKTLTYISGNGWAIPHGAEHPELACTWMKAITSVNAWMTAAKARAATARAKHQAFTGLYTANRVADRRIQREIKSAGSPQYAAAVKILTSIQDNAVTFPASPAGVQVQQALTDAINRVLVGSQQPQAALARAQSEAQRAIDAATS
jgi:multiple sugar transport system substrate-binding protein